MPVWFDIGSAGQPAPVAAYDQPAPEGRQHLALGLRPWLSAAATPWLSAAATAWLLSGSISDPRFNLSAPLQRSVHRHYMANVLLDIGSTGYRHAGLGLADSI